MMVYVLDMNGQPLMPTCNGAKVRVLLKQKRAKVVSKCPFTIKLLYESTKFIQPLTLGVDTGSKYVGSAVINDLTSEVVYESQVELRDDIKSKMDRRRVFRRVRRNKLRYRPKRFNNRKASKRKERYSPTLTSKFQGHTREIEFVKSTLPVTNVVLEVGEFDTQLLQDPTLAFHKWDYAKGELYQQENFKQAARARDGYKCQCCGKKNCRLEVHHIKFRSNGGTNDEDNLITLCKECHDGVHAGTIVLNKKPKKSKGLKHATHMSIIRSWLLRKYPDAIETFGFVTSENRNHLKLEKDHYIDACVIASGGLEFKGLDVIYRKRRISVQDRILTKGIRSERKLPTGKVHGFKRYDKVKYFREVCFVKGRRTNGGFVLMDINNISIDFRDRGGKQNPSYRFIERINTRRSVLCIKERIKREVRFIPVPG